MKGHSRKSSGWLGARLLLAPMLLFVGSSCTDLKVEPHDALTPDNAFHTDAEILAGVAGVYATLRAVEWVGYMTLEDLTTDMAIVPTRGSDWYDNGQWLDLHRQTWTANSSGTLAFVNGAWNDLFGAIAKENLMISVVAKAGGCDATTLAGCTSAKSDTSLAELRTLRAWDYYMLTNMFGGVPLVTTTELKQYTRSTRPQLFSFIESELLAARASLPATWPSTYQGRVTKGAANAMLASLYLNAGVLNKDIGPTAAPASMATGYNTCSGVSVTGGDACTQAIAAATAVINSGTYTLAANWKDNFSTTNKGAAENIFVIVHVAEQGLGGSWPMRTLHYNQLSTGWGSPWNGFATIAETFNQFTATDDRTSMWLVGQQKSFETGANVNDRTGKPLIFTAAIADANSATESEGVRFNKFPPVPSAITGQSHTNDFPFFRLAEMYLIKAEAENEAGQLAAAQADFNVIHNRHDPTNPVVAATKQAMRDAILKERLLEFAAEGKRRTDLIRQGKFTSWTEPSVKNGVAATARDVHFIVYPIPAPQIASNPKLTQNAGY